ncbi:MAG TPA: sugar phosphate nucleotidyltransferase [Gemmataceae bacterium]|nr:sugar phosphate nucleotidyltransferase [Gemmataceae bacterium]
MNSPSQCVILAGGLGTRMRPQTDRVPKTLLPVGGTPFAHYQLSWLARHGATEVVYCIGHLGDRVRAFVGDGARWGVTVRYVEDGDTLVGTGGALRQALDFGLLRDEFLLLYGDSFLPFDFRLLANARAEQWRPAMMAVYRNRGKYQLGNVRYANGLVQFYQKARGDGPAAEMPYVDYGISALRADLVAEKIPARATCDLADVFHRLSLEGRLAGYEVYERFYEIGSPAGLADFTEWVAGHADDSWIRTDRLAATTHSMIGC